MPDEDFMEEFERKCDCEHRYKVLQVVCFKEYVGNGVSKYIRSSVYYCEKCLDEVEKVKEETGRKPPKWYKEQ